MSPRASFWRDAERRKNGRAPHAAVGAPVLTQNPLHSHIHGKWAMALDVCVVEGHHRRNPRKRALSNARKRQGLDTMHRRRPGSKTSSLAQFGASHVRLCHRRSGISGLRPRRAIERGSRLQGLIVGGRRRGRRASPARAGTLWTFAGQPLRLGGSNHSSTASRRPPHFHTSRARTRRIEFYQLHDLHSRRPRRL